MVQSCFLNDTAPTEIYTLPLHDPLPIFGAARLRGRGQPFDRAPRHVRLAAPGRRLDQLVEGEVGGPVGRVRSEEHTSELQSRQYLVCRLLLEKKQTHTTQICFPFRSTQR